MKKYHIVGAFDRHNYGDILFPLVHTQFIKNKVGDNAAIEYYSVTAADLRQHGGVKTKTIKELIQQGVKENDKIIMSGGDILSVGWPLMIGHVSSGIIHFSFRVINKILGFNLANQLARRMYSQLNKFPYILSRNNINGRIYYSCVGGSGFEGKKNSKHLMQVVDELKMSEHISVRDNVILNILRKEGVICDLVPDSALIMSDLFSIEHLSHRDWSANIIHNDNFQKNNYFIFQAGKIFIEANISEIISQLENIYMATGMSILLLPIGRATGHEDHKILDKIYHALVNKKCPVGFQNSAHVMDIMASLAFCQSYLGTSLHGAISAYSFGHKVCGFSTAKVKKLGAFLETWMDIEDCTIVNDLNFSNKFLNLIYKEREIVNMNRLKTQKEMIYSDLENYI